MEFTLKTVYDQKACTAMAKAARKTVRKKRSRRVHIFGWIVIVLALLLTLPLGNEAYVITAKTVFTWIVTAIMLAAMLFEDHLNGFITKKRVLPGSASVTTVFTDENYTTTTPIASTHWQYENIAAIAEVGTYLVFFFSTSHAQIYDLRAVEGGTADEFKAFLTEKTEKPVLPLNRKKK